MNTNFPTHGRGGGMIRTHGEMNGCLDFCVVSVPCPGGGERHTVMAFSPDGRMWMDPGEFGIGPQHAPKLREFPGGKYLLVDDRGEKVFINAKAVILVVGDADWGRKWLGYVERMIKEHQEVRSRHESNRNN